MAFMPSFSTKQKQEKEDEHPQKEESHIYKKHHFKREGTKEMNVYMGAAVVKQKTCWEATRRRKSSATSISVLHNMHFHSQSTKLSEEKLDKSSRCTMLIQQQQKCGTRYDTLREA